MKKLIFALFAVLAVCVSSCSKYDDSDLWNSVNDLDKRVKTLEELCKQMNTNITSIQTIINASKDGDYITSITPLTEGGKEIGYTITFSKSPSITIYHGKDGQNGANGSDGKDGITPNISVKMDTDGYYYWTINGDWLLDDEGNKVYAQGVVGADGITPKFKVENGEWYISLDNGNTWSYIGRVGQNNGKPLFSNIDTSNPDYVIFTLADGTEFKVARHDELSISFDSEDLIAMQPNTTRTINYTISGLVDNLKVEVLSSGNVRAKVNDNTSPTGTLLITTGATIDEYDKVVVLVCNGKTTIMRCLSFEEAGLRVNGDLFYEVAAEGQILNINIETNAKYSISIPNDAQSWISQELPSRAWRSETISFRVHPNESTPRIAKLDISDSSGTSFTNITISQKSKAGESTLYIPEDMSEAFPDENFRNYVIEEFDLNKDGRISSDEAIKVQFVYVWGRQDINSVKGIEYFLNLKELYVYYTNVINLDLSNNSELTTLNCSLCPISSLDVSNNRKLESLECYGYELLSLNLSENAELQTLNIDFNPINSLDLSNNTKLRLLSCRNNKLSVLDLRKNVELNILDCEGNLLSQLDLSNNQKLTKINCSENKLVTLDVSKTNIINSTLAGAPLDCSNMTSLQTLILKKGWSISGITEDNGRSEDYIPEHTQIIYVE